MIKFIEKTFSKYNLVIREAIEGDIEGIRLLRNHSSVAQYMVYKNEISSEQQKQWWKSLDKNKNYYCVLLVGSDLAGVVNIKDINPSEGSAEWGIFLDQKYRGQVIGMIGVLEILEFAFTELNLKLMRATILTTNTEAISMNSALGFVHERSSDGIEYWTSTKENFFEKTKIARKILKK